MALYDYQGNIVSQDGDITINVEGNGATDYDKIVKGIAHRGYGTAPENTLPAYKLAKQMGFNYVECDVRFTSDGYAMLLHDTTIDRTSNSSGTLSQMTYAQVRQYDFGSWKSATYTGTVIPTFEEFISLCRSIMLCPYVELKEATEAQVQNLVNLVSSYNMNEHVTWISSNTTYLGYVKNYDATARLGCVGAPTSSRITAMQNLKTANNEVFIDSSSLTDDSVALCKNANLPMEVWTIDNASTIISANPYISGFTSNLLIAGKVLYENELPQGE